MASRKETRVVEIRVDSKQFRAATRGINSNLKGIQKEAKRTGDSFRNMFSFFAAREVLYWGRNLVQGLAEVERMDAVLKGASASQEEFAESSQFVSDIAEEYGLNVLHLQEGFAHFSAAAREAGVESEVMKRTFEGLTVSAAAFLVSGTELQLMLQGARQLMGSATTNMEDLRQVTERLPGSMGAAVRAIREMSGDLDLNAQEMKKMIAEGKIATDVFFPLFSRRLEEMNLKGAAENSKTFTAELNRLNNAFIGLKRALVEGGVLTALAKFVTLATKAVNVLTSLPGGDPGSLRAQMAGVDPIAGDIAAYEQNIERRNREMEALIDYSDMSYEYPEYVKRLKELNQVDKENIAALYEKAEALKLSNDALKEEQDEVDKTADELNNLLKQHDALSNSANKLGGSGAGSLSQVGKSAEDTREELRKLREEALDLQSLWDPMYDLQKQFAEGADLIAEAERRGAISGAQAAQLAEDFSTYMAEQEQQISKNTDALKDLDDVAKDLADTFVDAFDAMIFGGESFRDVLRSLEQQLVSMVAKNLFFDPLSDALAGSDLFGWVASAVAPRQFGGPVEANTPYLVGERGPELFAPSQSGTIISNEDLMGSGPNGVSVVMNFNAPVSGDGLRQSANQLAAQVGAQMQRALYRNG